MIKRIGIKCKKNQQKGIMRIGSISIFIAILTNASIAAGVFLDSVEVLREDAIETVEQAIAEESTHIKIRSMYGIREEDGLKITQLYLHMGLGPGCPPQNLSYMLIHLED